jgi:hypothetical protein
MTGTILQVQNLNHALNFLQGARSMDQALGDGTTIRPKNDLGQSRTGTCMRIRPLQKQLELFVD